MDDFANDSEAGPRPTGTRVFCMLSAHGRSVHFIRSVCNTYVTCRILCTSPGLGCTTEGTSLTPEILAEVVCELVGFSEVHQAFSVHVDHRIRRISDPSPQPTLTLTHR